ncbi:MAG: hypothetical protein QM744_01250 [Mesorhizobium sp.]
MIIVIKPGRKSYVAEWQEAFAELAPHIDVRELDDPDRRSRRGALCSDLGPPARAARAVH